MSEIVSVSLRAVQDQCASVFRIPLSKGAIQKMVHRVSEDLVPHYEAIGCVARTAPGQSPGRNLVVYPGCAALAVGDDQSLGGVFPDSLHSVADGL